MALCFVWIQRVIVLYRPALDRVQYVAYARPPNTEWVRSTVYSNATLDGKAQQKGEQQA